MKLFLLLLLPLLAFQLKAQDKYLGAYHDYHGGYLTINADSTFNYTWHFDTEGSWSNGTWRIINDTIFFNTIPVYDTAKLDTYFNQISQLAPDKLYYRKDKLFGINKNGKLIKGKIKGFGTKKQYPAYYIRQRK